MMTTSSPASTKAMTVLRMASVAPVCTEISDSASRGLG
jgi:hypothetical protein